MSAMPAGILLPESILTAPWFGVFAAFVAFNTVIYLGLTLAKFIPWPAPVGPTALRRVIPLDPEEVSTMRFTAPSSPMTTAAEIRLRGESARETIPVAFTLVGALTVLVSLVNTALYLATVGPTVLVGAVAGVVFIILGQVVSRTRISNSVAVWTWSLAMVFLVCETSWRAAVLNSAVLLAYAAMALLVAAPVSLSWPAGITAALLGLVPIAFAGYDVSAVDTVSWVIAAATGSVASLVLLYLRITAIDRIAEEERRATALASTDPLTGTFSRAGLIALAPSVADAATASGTDVGVITCTLPDLTTINAEYGFDYGGQVLAATSRALRASLPERALIARWGGQTFLALMTGSAPPADELRGDVAANLDLTGIALGKRPITISVGTASAPPESTTLETLVAEAESASA